MSYSTFNHVKISGFSVILPSNVIYNVEDYLYLFENNPKKLAREKKIAGYGTRYFSPENITSVDMCEVAAQDIIDNMNIDINTIDGLIFISQRPDYIIPASANVLHGKLNLPETCAVFDVNQGCTGYIYGLWLASSLIESKACKKILLLVSDHRSDKRRKPYAAKTKEMGLLFSAAGSATLLEYSEDIVKSSYLIGADGKGFEKIISPFGGSRLPITKEILDYYIVDKYGNRRSIVDEFMDGIAVFDFTIQVVPEHVRQLLKYSEETYGTIDFFAFHQANKQIVEIIALELGLPENKYTTDTFINYGNTASTSSLTNLVDKFGGGIINNVKAAIVSYGIGLSWASAIVNLQNTYSSGIKLYNFKAEKTKEELIEYWANKMRN